MGVGIAPTKTLAKSAQWATKQWPQFSGVVALTAENRNRILKLLGLQPVGEVWGVGRRLTEKLNALGINTALQLALSTPRLLAVLGMRTISWTALSFQPALLAVHFGADGTQR